MSHTAIQGNHMVGDEGVDRKQSLFADTKADERLIECHYCCGEFPIKTMMHIKRGWVCEGCQKCPQTQH